MIINLIYPQKYDWSELLDALLRRCPFAKVVGQSISFADKPVGILKFSENVFSIEGDWERGVKCIAMIAAEMTGITILGGTIRIDNQVRVDLEDLNIEVGDLIAEENYRLEHNYDLVEKEIRLSKLGSQKMTQEEFEELDIPDLKWDDDLKQVVLPAINEQVAMNLAKKYHLNWWIKLEA